MYIGATNANDLRWEMHCDKITNDDDDYTDKALSSARSPRSTSSVFCFHVFLSLTDSCSLLVPRLSRPTDWIKVLEDCIHVFFCRPLCLVTGFNTI